MKILIKLYVILMAALISIPLFGMSFWMTRTTTEGKEQTPFPSLMDNGSLNISFLSQLGFWFEDHYAFRQQMITANSKLETGLFSTSPVDQVVLGKDGWYFYSQTLDDYTGKSLLSERELFAAIHNLKLMQWSAQSQGSRFIVLLPPNKNSVYPEKMPESYLQAEEKNLAILQQAMQENGIEYVNVWQSLVEHKGENLYYKKDSHWNHQGSLLAYQQLMASLGLVPKEYDTASAQTVRHNGDLEEMLFPEDLKGEDDLSYDEQMVYTPRLQGDALMENWIETENPSGQGSLLMFRDSYGINLIPYLADTFEKGWFSRLEPYNFVQIQNLQPDITIVEKTERRIDQFAQSPAIMIMPTVNLEPNGSAPGESTMSLQPSGDFYYISGRIDPTLMQDQSEIYLRLLDQNGNCIKTVATFYLVDTDSGIDGYGVYLPASDLPEGTSLDLVVQNGSDFTSVAYTNTQKGTEQE